MPKCFKAIAEIFRQLYGMIIDHMSSYKHREQLSWQLDCFKNLQSFLKSLFRGAIIYLPPCTVTTTVFWLPLGTDKGFPKRYFCQLFTNHQSLPCPVSNWGRPMSNNSLNECFITGLKFPIFLCTKIWLLITLQPFSLQGSIVLHFWNPINI